MVTESVPVMADWNTTRGLPSSRWRVASVGRPANRSQVAVPRSVYCIGCPRPQAVCCRVSEDDDQLHQVSRLHVIAQGSRGSHRVIQHHRQGVRSGASRGTQSGTLTQSRYRSLSSTIADGLGRPAELRRRNHASRGPSQWCATRWCNSRSAGRQSVTCPVAGALAPGYRVFARR